MNDESLDFVSERVEIQLSSDEISAVEGWRKANGLFSREDAIRQLVRLGLLSEIGRIYQGTNRG